MFRNVLVTAMMICVAYGTVLAEVPQLLNYQGKLTDADGAAIEGEVTVKTPTGEVNIEPGDLVTFPKGLSCEWKVKKPIRKVYNFK